MNYAYDIVLNLTDEVRFVEFYEWTENDNIEHIKRMPIIYIKSNVLKDLFNYKIKIDKEFIKKIANKSICYGINNIKYGCIFTDKARAIAMEFDSRGFTIGRSSLLLDEEEDIIDEMDADEILDIKYEILKEDKDIFITRDDVFKKRYLLLELKNILQEKNEDKLNFLYEEIFKKDKLSFRKRVEKMINSINNEYSSKHNYLFEILRLANTKK